MNFNLIAEAAFRAHEEKRHSKEVQACVNGTAMSNGYADQYGLPFPEVEDRNAT